MNEKSLLIGMGLKWSFKCTYKCRRMELFIGTGYSKYSLATYKSVRIGKFIGALFCRWREKQIGWAYFKWFGRNRFVF